MLRKLRYFSFRENSIRMICRFVEKLKYLAAAFVSHGRQNKKLDGRGGKASVVMPEIQHLVVMKQEVFRHTKGLI